MKNEKVLIELPSKAHSYEIEIGANILSESGEFARKSLSKTAQKIILISNKKVFGLYGEVVKNSLENAGFKVAIWLMGDGELHKNLRSLGKALAFFSANKLTRNDAVIALGGGVVGDLSGFAAAIFQRGIPFLQIPTTLLAQIDSSVGGKTAVNSTFGKNLIGAFHQPNGVLIDIETLKTLPRREVVAGFSEAIKQGAIASPELFYQTSEFLKEFSVTKFKSHFSSHFSADFRVKLKKLIKAQVSFKAEIVVNDETENISRADSRSRKILNFGHTIGHALEKVTNYKRFKHGEAVALGMIVAADISKNLAFCDEDLLTLFKNVVSSLGELPKTNDIRTEDVFSALVYDKKSVGEEIQWILLEQIGKPMVVSRVPEQIIRQSLQNNLQTLE